jgi:ribosome-binding protein aMBF1 (putative translation factor)
MGGLSFPEMSCKICGKPVDLTVELHADENGKAVHDDCYVKRIAKSHRNPSDTMMAD